MTNLTGWKRWAVEIILTVSLTIAGNALVLGRFVEKIYATESKVQKLEEADEKLRASDADLIKELSQVRVDKETIAGQLKSIQMGIEDLKIDQRDTRQEMMRLIRSKSK